MELAVGRGSDMLKWIHADVADIVGIDVDNDGLVELQGDIITSLKKIIFAKYENESSG